MQKFFVSSLVCKAVHRVCKCNSFYPFHDSFTSLQLKWSKLHICAMNLAQHFSHSRNKMVTILALVTLACENSRPSSLPAQVAFHVKGVCDSPPKIPYWWRKRELYNFEKIIICSHERFVLTSDVQSILETPLTDEIHMEGRNHGLDSAEQRQTHSTDLRVNSCIWIMSLHQAWKT